jgi:hypothetical protein
MSKRLLLLTPPLLQPNCPYPATPHLVGFLQSRGFDVHQRDLSIKVTIDILREYGGDEIEELIEFLQGPAPFGLKREASAIINELALWIRDNVDEYFGFSRYAEQLCSAIYDFGDFEKLIRRRSVMDSFLFKRLKEALEEVRPDVVGFTCPFPGTLVAAFKAARYIRRYYPKIRIVIGGGFISTELRSMNDKRPKKYFDDFILDEGYIPLAKILAPHSKLTLDDVPVFVKPSYQGLDMSEYFDVVETDNHLKSLWSAGKWRKLIMARGCYWHKCAFCDVKLPYIGCFKMPSAVEIVDAMEELGTMFHFVDEAMPPKLVKDVCEEIHKRGFKCQWWGNIRFDNAFTTKLAKLMAKAGCIAVTGGLECANDRLLKLMNKGITLASSKKVLKAFRSAGISVHAYLMYAFPTETKAEAMSALEYVCKLFDEGLIESAFWHRFALTVHSPVAANPETFGIKIVDFPPNEKHRIFSLNEIFYEEPSAPNWDVIGKKLVKGISKFF